MSDLLYNLPLVRVVRVLGFVPSEYEANELVDVSEGVACWYPDCSEDLATFQLELRFTRAVSELSYQRTLRRLMNLL